MIKKYDHMMAGWTPAKIPNYKFQIRRRTQLDN